MIDCNKVKQTKLQFKEQTNLNIFMNYILYDLLYPLRTNLSSTVLRF